MTAPVRIVSGAQTGADRAGLDFAIEWGIAYGGWVPKGRLDEVGTIPARYEGLTESGSPDPAVRTRLNVRDSDGTLIVSHGPLAGGSLLTQEEAIARGKPCLHLDLSTMDVPTAGRRLRQWLDSESIRTLNVAGPRASEDGDIYAATLAVLRTLLTGGADRQTP